MRLNTLRNQMLAGFLAVMTAVLALVGVMTFGSVSVLLKTNSEKHIHLTTVQAEGRLEALVRQIDTLTLQIATDPYVQALLSDARAGRRPSFAERQALTPIANKAQVFSAGVRAIELYGMDDARLFPLDDKRLIDRAGADAVRRADEQNGRLVWFAADPEDASAVFALRVVRLIDRSFAPGGYLLAKIDRSYFGFREAADGAGNAEIMLLVDDEGRLVAADGLPSAGEFVDPKTLLADDGPVVTAGGEEYVMAKRRSDVTDWTLVVLTPVSAITEGVAVLRTALLLSGATGAVLFLLLSLLLSTMITRPILKLIKSMRSARFGELKTSPNVSSTREIRELTHTYNRMVEDLNRLIRLVYEKEMLRSRAELQALQARINPHFLYNTLEAFYWSLQEKGEEELADLVVALSELFRYLTGGPERGEWVTVAEELEQVERYLRLMKARLGDRLEWNIALAPEVRAAVLPKLLIQPLVENAIRHGVEPKIGRGSVSVAVGPSPDAPGRVSVVVADDGVGMDEAKLREVLARLADDGFRQASPEAGADSPGRSDHRFERSDDRAPAGEDRLRNAGRDAGKPAGADGPQSGGKSGSKGIGLRNVHRRLALSFPDDPAASAGLAVMSERGRGTTVSFSIPYREVAPDGPAQNHPDR